MKKQLTNNFQKVSAPRLPNAIGRHDCLVCAIKWLEKLELIALVEQGHVCRQF